MVRTITNLPITPVAGKVIALAEFSFYFLVVRSGETFAYAALADSTSGTQPVFVHVSTSAVVLGLIDVFSIAFALSSKSVTVAVADTAFKRTVTVTTFTAECFLIFWLFAVALAYHF